MDSSSPGNVSFIDQVKEYDNKRILLRRKTHLYNKPLNLIDAFDISNDGKTNSDDEATISVEKKDRIKNKKVIVYQDVDDNSD